LDAQKVKLFLLVAKYRNFTAVAKDFSYTPSAVSHMADALETELGIKLFIRTNKGVRLTEEGNKMYDSFLSLANAQEALLQNAAALAAQHKHILRIGTYSSIALHVLPGILQNFKQEYPFVKTTITVDDYMQEWLKQGIVDVILADEQVGDELWIPILEDAYVAVVPENEFANQEEISVEELYRCTFIKSSEMLLEKYLDYSRFGDIIEVKSVEDNSLIFMVKEKLGITILPNLSIHHLPEGVKALRLKPGLKRTIGVSYDPKRASWACERFVRHIKKLTWA